MSASQPLPPLWFLGTRLAVDPSCPSGLRWSLGRRRGLAAGNQDRSGYWRIAVPYEGRRHRLMAHRVVYFLSHERDPGALEVDHMDRDKGNNRIENLRLATHRENAQNLPARASGSSHYKGVSFHAARGNWRAFVGDEYLGSFSTEESAARAYDAAALELHGEFASLNFPAGRVAS